MKLKAILMLIFFSLLFSGNIKSSYHASSDSSNISEQHIASLDMLIVKQLDGLKAELEKIKARNLELDQYKELKIDYKTEILFAILFLFMIIITFYLHKNYQSSKIIKEVLNEEFKDNISTINKFANSDIINKITKIFTIYESITNGNLSKDMNNLLEKSKSTVEYVNDSVNNINLLLNNLENIDKMYENEKFFSIGKSLNDLNTKIFRINSKIHEIPLKYDEIESLINENIGVRLTNIENSKFYTEITQYKTKLFELNNTLLLFLQQIFTQNNTFEDLKETTKETNNNILLFTNDIEKKHLPNYINISKKIADNLENFKLANNGLNNCKTESAEILQKIIDFNHLQANNIKQLKEFDTNYNDFDEHIKSYRADMESFIDEISNSITSIKNITESSKFIELKSKISELISVKKELKEELLNKQQIIKDSEIKIKNYRFLSENIDNLDLNEPSKFIEYFKKLNDKFKQISAIYLFRKKQNSVKDKIQSIEEFVEEYKNIFLPGYKALNEGMISKDLYRLKFLIDIFNNYSSQNNIKDSFLIEKLFQQTSNDVLIIKKALDSNLSSSIELLLTNDIKSSFINLYKWFYKLYTWSKLYQEKLPDEYYLFSSLYGFIDDLNKQIGMKVTYPEIFKTEYDRDIHEQLPSGYFENYFGDFYKDSSPLEEIKKHKNIIYEIGRPQMECSLLDIKYNKCEVLFGTI